MQKSKSNPGWGNDELLDEMEKVIYAKLDTLVKKEDNAGTAAAIIALVNEKKSYTKS